MEHVVIEYNAAINLPKAANGERVVRCNFGSADISADAARVAHNVAKQFGRATVQEHRTRPSEFRVFLKSSNLTLATVKPVTEG